MSLHTFYSLSATILLHPKVLWHIEVIFLEISCFCKKLHLLVFSNSWELHFSKLQRAESVLKLFKQHGLQNYVLWFIEVNITMVECYKSMVPIRFSCMQTVLRKQSMMFILIVDKTFEWYFYSSRIKYKSKFRFESIHVCRSQSYFLDSNNKLSFCKTTHKKTYK